MATAFDQYTKDETEMRECFSFTLILSGFDEITSAIEDAIYEAGCSDAMLGIHAGSPYLAFDREAESLEEAIRSAIKNVEQAGHGIEVVRVIPPGADTIDTINAYLQVRRQVLRKIESLGPDVAHRVDEFLAALAECNPAALTHALNVK